MINQIKHNAKAKHRTPAAAKKAHGSVKKVVKLTAGQKIVQKMLGKGTVKISAEEVLAITRGRV